MGKEKAASSGSLLQGVFNLGIYKRTQGRYARQVTCGTIWAVFALAAWRLSETMVRFPNSWRYGVSLTVLIIGIWLGYRLVNMHKFADFLIAVEAEMNKVSWPARPELFRSSLVVIFVIFFMAFVLFGYDLFWQSSLKVLGVRTGKVARADYITIGVGLVVIFGAVVTWLSRPKRD